ncbi:MAG TPA: hypothetical protein VMV74_05330 [Bacteroidales bacterium]|nr:hypothetical protein [Bacteroidales bacterium]
MKRRNKILLILPLFILPATDIFCQDKMTNIVFIRDRFSEYVNAIPFEDIYVHSDRDSYTAGESVWFRIYLFDRGSGNLSDRSSLAYVEILDPYSRPVAQAKTVLEKGTGAALLELPDTLTNGSYTLRAFTNRMKSFMPDGCFMKNITVVNPFNDRFLNFRVFGKTSEEKPFRVSFYPEGGKLIAGLSCRLGITVLNKYGMPAGCSGVIKNDAEEIIARVDIDSTGIGSLRLIPEAERNLYFEADNHGGVFALPPVSETGSALMVVRNRNDSLVISMQSNDNPGYSLNLVVRSRGTISYTASIPVSGEETLISLRGEILVPGINDLVLFDASGNLLSERLIFKPLDKDGRLHVDCSPVYGRREKVSIEIVNDGQPDPQNDLNVLSLSVSLHPEGRSFGGADEFLLTGTEYILPEPGSILPEIFPSLSSEKKDILLFGTESLWIDWKEIVSGQWMTPEYLSEKEGQYISVSFFDQKGLLPQRGSTAFMTSPGKKPEFQYSVIDSTGRFSFFIENNSQLKDLIFQPSDTSGSYSAKIEDKFPEKYPRSVFIPDTVREYIPEETAALAGNFQIQKIYENSGRGGIIVPSLKSTDRPRFYGKPDQELVMDDYIALPTMREVFFELVRKVSVRTNRKENSYMIYDPVLKRYPALFIDGVPIDEAAKIVNLNPAHVEQIDVLLCDYRIGDLIFPGIINVITRTGTYSDIPLPKNAVRVGVKMFDPDWSFISPDYSTEEKRQQRIPDFRNTLFWSPELKTDASGKMTVEFWTSDFSSEYLIDLEGITSQGKVISVRKAVTVK